ncbi:hydrogenase maturation protease [Thermodesulfobacteriota bacterium]
MRVLILGMGNPMLADDGVGIRVAQEVGTRIPDAKVITSTVVGLNLLDIIAGFDKAFIIDAALGTEDGLGKVKVLSEDEGSLHLFSSHGLNFPDILKLGRELGHTLPEDVTVYGIEIGALVSFSEELSPELTGKLQSIADRIARNIEARLQGSQ